MSLKILNSETETRMTVLNSVLTLLTLPVITFYPWTSVVLALILVAITLNLDLKMNRANTISILRLLLLISSFIAYDAQSIRLEVFIIFSLANIIVFDGIDGRIARKYGEESKAGEVLDIETDSMQVLLTTIILSNFIGIWIIFIGILRYIYVILSSEFEKTNTPSSTFAKFVGGISSSTLVMSLYFVKLSVTIAIMADIAVSVLLLISFTRSFIQLFKLNSMS